MSSNLHRRTSATLSQNSAIMASFVQFTRASATLGDGVCQGAPLTGD